MTPGTPMTWQTRPSPPSAPSRPNQWTYPPCAWKGRNPAPWSGRSGFAKGAGAATADPAASRASNDASGSLQLNCRVEPLQLDPGVGGGELPVDLHRRRVPRPLPGRHLAPQGLPCPGCAGPGTAAPARSARISATFSHDAVLGRVVPLEPLRQPPRLRRLERLVQRRRRVRVQVVAHQHDPLGRRVPARRAAAAGTGRSPPPSSARSPPRAAARPAARTAMNRLAMPSRSYS